MSNFNQPQWGHQQWNSRRPSAVGDDRLWAMLAHLSAAIGWLLSAGWLNFVGPLVLWLLFKDRSPFVRRAAAGAFNFTLGMTLMSAVGWLLVLTVLLAPIGLLMIAASGVLVILFGCIGAYKVFHGSSFTYPWQFKLLS